MPRETATGERRVAIVPESVAKLKALGLDVGVERGAGREAAFADGAYEEAGAELVDKALGADIVAKVAPPSEWETDALERDAVLVGFLAPLTNPKGIERLEAQFPRRAFSPHRHDIYAIGITLSGVQRFRYRGAMRTCLPGECHLLHPDELHEGHAAT